MIFFAALVEAKERTVQDRPEEEESTAEEQRANCCACPDNKKDQEQKEIEERQAQMEIFFENYLQQNIYCKRLNIYIIIYRSQTEYELTLPEYVVITNCKCIIY